MSPSLTTAARTTTATRTTATTTAQARTTAGTDHPTAPPVSDVELRFGDDWLAVCDLDWLVPGRGVAVLLPDGSQAALFRVRDGRLYAVGNRDPFSGAEVLSRGLTGTRDGAVVLFSPMYKQAFDLVSGRCLDEDTAPDGSPAVLPTWPVRRRR